MKINFKGWRTIAANVITFLVTLAGWEELSKFVDPQHIVQAQAVLNILLRLLTTTPVGKVDRESVAPLVLIFALLFTSPAYAANLSPGCSATVGSAVPTCVIDVGVDVAGNARIPTGVDADTGAGTEYVLKANLVFRASGGSVEAGTAADPFSVTLPSAMVTAENELKVLVTPTASSGTGVGISTATTTVIKASPGFLKTVSFHGGAAGTFLCYKNASAASGELIVEIDIPTNAGSIVVNENFENGLTCVTSAATKARVQYE